MSKPIICIQVPFESLKRVSRERKYNIDDLGELVSAITSLAERNCSEAERKQNVESLIQRAKNLKNQVSFGRPRASKFSDQGIKSNYQLIDNHRSSASDANPAGSAAFSEI